MAAQRQLSDLFREVLTEAVEAGFLRGDVSPAELANYSVHALSAAADLPSKDAVDRLGALTLTGLR